jgi:DNA-binding transcriptional ArsR family regulator
VESADFLFHQRLTGLTGGNLSTHLSRLAEAGLVYIEKQFIDRHPNTQIQITAQGLTAIEAHWKKLEELRKTSLNWQTGNPS